MQQQQTAPTSPTGAGLGLPIIARPGDGTLSDGTRPPSPGAGGGYGGGGGGGSGGGGSPSGQLFGARPPSQAGAKNTVSVGTGTPPRSGGKKKKKQGGGGGGGSITQYLSTPTKLRPVALEILGADASRSPWTLIRPESRGRIEAAVVKDRVPLSRSEATRINAQLDGMLKAWRAEELSSWQLASALAAPTTGLQEGFDRSVSGRLTAAPKERAYDLVLANLLAQARLKLQHLADTHEKRQNRTVLPIKRELARLQGRERAFEAEMESAVESTRRLAEMATGQSRRDARLREEAQRRAQAKAVKQAGDTWTRMLLANDDGAQRKLKEEQEAAAARMAELEAVIAAEQERRDGANEVAVQTEATDEAEDEMLTDDELARRVQYSMQARVNLSVGDVEAVFRSVDADNSGSLSAAEIMKACSKVRGLDKLPKWEVATLVRRIDGLGNSDGEIDYAEFADFVMRGRNGTMVREMETQTLEEDTMYGATGGWAARRVAAAASRTYGSVGAQRVGEAQEVSELKALAGRAERAQLAEARAAEEREDALLDGFEPEPAEAGGEGAELLDAQLLLTGRQLGRMLAWARKEGHADGRRAQAEAAKQAKHAAEVAAAEAAAQAEADAAIALEGGGEAAVRKNRPKPVFIEPPPPPPPPIVVPPEPTLANALLAGWTADGAALQKKPKFAKRPPQWVCRAALLMFEAAARAAEGGGDEGCAAAAAAALAAAMPNAGAAAAAKKEGTRLLAMPPLPRGELLSAPGAFGRHVADVCLACVAGGGAGDAGRLGQGGYSAGQVGGWSVGGGGTATGRVGALTSGGVSAVLAARRWLRELLLSAQAAARGSKKDPKGNDLARRLVRLADSVAASPAHELASATEPLELLKAAAAAERPMGAQEGFPLEPLTVSVPSAAAAPPPPPGSAAGFAGAPEDEEATVWVPSAWVAAEDATAVVRALAPRADDAAKALIAIEQRFVRGMPKDKKKKKGPSAMAVEWADALLAQAGESGGLPGTPGAGYDRDEKLAAKARALESRVDGLAAGWRCEKRFVFEVVAEWEERFLLRVGARDGAHALLLGLLREAVRGQDAVQQKAAARGAGLTLVALATVLRRGLGLGAPAGAGYTLGSGAGAATALGMGELACAVPLSAGAAEAKASAAVLDVYKRTVGVDFAVLQPPPKPPKLSGSSAYDDEADGLRPKTPKTPKTPSKKKGKKGKGDAEPEIDMSLYRRVAPVTCQPDEVGS
jgi:hypothetical protein